MLSARFKESGEPFSVEMVDIPSIGPGEVLVEIKAAGICGTDIHYRKGDSFPSKVPLTLGHEGAGVVKKVGANVSNVKTGDHVVVHYVISCGNCKPCLQGFDNRCRNRTSIGHDVDGTFAEFIKIPSRNAFVMADHIPFEWGAITACAVSTAFHAVKRSGLKRGDTAVVFGTGGVGIHAVLWSKFFGAGKVIAVDLVDSKLEASRMYGADILVNPTREDVLKTVRKETGGWGADVVIECSGSAKAMKQAIKAIKGRNRFESGTCVSVGFQPKPFQAEYWNFREGWLTVSGDHTRFDLLQIIKLLEAGRIDLSRSITHRIPLQDINIGMELVESGKEHVERAVVDMNL
ncbi:MAG: alcohol dehydrogenase catalytic domain-containing protein [Candidatus Bathyarchaeota archaeon]|nr:alcohol dehydrogenase catalytic domain-containing protein [Candidatus Bathyarchaeota archaeon]